MTKLENEKWHGCPIRFLAGIVGDQWSLLIIRDIMFYDKHTYGEFLEAGEGISTNILADRLVRLEHKGILKKSVDPENHKRNLYHLTPMGRDFLPVMLAIMDWSEKHDPKTEVPKEWITKLRANPKKFANELLGKIETDALSSCREI